MWELKFPKDTVDMAQAEITLDLHSIGVDIVLTDDPASYALFMSRDLDAEVLNHIAPCDDSELPLADKGTNGEFVPETVDERSRFSILGDVFIIESHIGQGANGIIGKCRHERTRQELAVKLIHLGDQPAAIKQHAIKEIVIQQFLFEQTRSVGSCVPQIVFVGLSEDTEDLFIVMDLLRGENVWTSIQHQKTLEAQYSVIRFAFLRFADISEMLYKRFEFIHGDMKFDNLFITDEPRILMIDFGCASLKLGDAEYTRLTTRRDVAGVSHPTRDLTMLALCIPTFVSNSLLMFKPLQNALNALLMNAVCDTSDPYWRGQLHQHPTHIPDPDTWFNPFPKFEWSNSYRRLMQHNNMNATPDAVRVAFAANRRASTKKARKGGRRRQKLTRHRSKSNTFIEQ